MKKFTYGAAVLAMGVGFASGAVAQDVGQVQCPNDLIAAPARVAEIGDPTLRAQAALMVDRAEQANERNDRQQCEQWLRQAYVLIGDIPREDVAVGLLPRAGQGTAAEGVTTGTVASTIPAEAVADMQCPNDLITAPARIADIENPTNRALAALMLDRAEERYNANDRLRCEQWLREAAAFWIADEQQVGVLDAARGSGAQMDVGRGLPQGAIGGQIVGGAMNQGAQMQMGDGDAFAEIGAVQCPNDLIRMPDLLAEANLTDAQRAQANLYLDRAEEAYNQNNLLQCEQWLQQAVGVAR